MANLPSVRSNLLNHFIPLTPFYQDIGILSLLLLICQCEYVILENFNAKKRATTFYLVTRFLFFYYFTNNDAPDISFGCSIPINSINVGAISAKHPPSRSLYEGSAFTKINGTGFVVCAVNGAPVS